MARKSASKVIEATAEPLELDDEQVENGSTEVDGAPLSQTDAVKAALDGGYEMPGEATDYIRDQYGMEVTKAYFSAIKSKLKSQGGTVKKRGYTRSAATVAKHAGASSTSQASARLKSAGGDEGLLKALEVMKPLVEKLGAEKVRRLVDLLG
ncbi:hypothetical protein EP7_005028 [Isosphaeraceae bacterium EP7]